MTVVRRGASVLPPKFREVNEAHTSTGFKAYVGKALEVLRANKTEIGQATYRYITSGKVKIDQMQDLTRPDFERARHTLAGWGKELSKADFEKLHDGRSVAARAVKDQLRGYMWDDRIYVEEGLSPQKLASTLVHEVNHVINRSEEHYRGDTQALLEEYRAFYAERLFAGDPMPPSKAKALKASVARSYEFGKARMGEIPDRPPGKMIPR